jgi:hypothetical protein
MTWNFYQKHLIYIAPYWLLLVGFMFAMIATASEKMHLPHTQMLFILCSIIIPTLFWWLMTPFTFLFLESFRPIKEYLAFKNAPQIPFENNTPLFIKTLFTTLVVIMHYTLEIARYTLTCGMITLLSFIVSPIVIVVIVMEKLLKKLFMGRI